MTKCKRLQMVAPESCERGRGSIIPALEPESSIAGQGPIFKLLGLPWGGGAPEFCDNGSMYDI